MIDKYLTRIEEYEDGLLSLEEVKAFEQELRSNPDLAKAYKQYQEAKQISEGLLEIDMMNTLQSLKNHKQNHEGKKQPSSWWKWIIATVSTALIAFVIWTMMQPDPHQEMKQYYAHTYEKPFDPDATKSIDTTQMTPFQLAKYYFSLNEFELSKYLLINQIESSTDFDSIQMMEYWLHHCYINLKEWDKVDLEKMKR